MDTCIIAGNCTTGSTGQVVAYANAQQALTQEKMTIWQDLFKNAPNTSQAVSLKNRLDQLQSQKHQIVHQAFNSAKGADSSTAPAQQQ